MATATPRYAQIRSPTFGTLSEADRSTSRSSWAWPEGGPSTFVLLCILGVYLHFTG